MPKLHMTLIDTIFAGCEKPNAASLLCSNGDGTCSFLAERIKQALRAHANAALEAAIARIQETRSLRDDAVVQKAIKVIRAVREEG